MKRQMTIALCAVLAASGAGCSDGSTSPAGDLGAARDQAGRAADMTDLTTVDPLAGSPQVSKLNLGTTFKYAQSPLWVASLNALLFSDTQSNMIYQLTLPMTLTPYRPSSASSNGLALDSKGNLVVCEFTTHQLTRHMLPAGTSYDTVVSAYNNTALNGPNDLTVRSDGTIYFTDPGSGPLGFQGLYRVAPSTGIGTTVSLDKTMIFPDGVALAPDEKMLYVAAASEGKIYRFPVNTDGTLGTRTVFAMNLGTCGGLAVDDGGNVYVATSVGVRVFRDDGSQRGSLPVPEATTNLGFGGPDRKTLFISSPTSIYSVNLQVPGRP